MRGEEPLKGADVHGGARKLATTHPVFVSPKGTRRRDFPLSPQSSWYADNCTVRKKRSKTFMGAQNPHTNITASVDIFTGVNGCWKVLHDNRHNTLFHLSRSHLQLTTQKATRLTATLYLSAYKCKHPQKATSSVDKDNKSARQQGGTTFFTTTCISALGAK